jgi:hypothetical protein
MSGEPSGLATLASGVALLMVLALAKLRGWGGRRKSSLQLAHRLKLPPLSSTTRRRIL